MSEVLLLAFLVFTGIAIIIAFIRRSGKYGEDCPYYPYRCPYCHKAARCIIEIGRKDK